jgi:hypothetical protein
MSTDNTRVARFLSVIWIECVLTFCFVATRMWVRIKVIRQLGWDDWAITAAMV